MTTTTKLFLEVSYHFKVILIVLQVPILTRDDLSGTTCTGWISALYRRKVLKEQAVFF